MEAVLIIAVLVIFNGIFVGAEFALIGAPRALIESRAVHGSQLAGRLSRLFQDQRMQDRYVATTQVGISLASLGLGMYGERTLAEWLFGFVEQLGWAGWLGSHALASFAAVSFLTYIHVVLGEMVPKSLALQHCEKSALWLYRPMQICNVLFSPLVFVLNGFANLTLRAFGVAVDGSAKNLLTPDELALLVNESRERGALSEAAGKLLQELMGFSELTAAEVMVPRVLVCGINLGADSTAIAQIMQEEAHARYPVYEDNLDHIVGAVHVKDILRVALENRALAPQDIHPVPFVPETATLDFVLATMRRERAQLVAVMDEHGGTAGIITLEDLFEEVVGEVDENLSGVREAPVMEDGKLRIPGTFRISEIGELFDLRLEHPDVDTASGLVLSLLNRPPQMGDEVRYQGISLTVTAVEGKAVSECVAVKEAAEEEKNR